MVLRPHLSACSCNYGKVITLITKYNMAHRGSQSQWRRGKGPRAAGPWQERGSGVAACGRAPGVAPATPPPPGPRPVGGGGPPWAGRGDGAPTGGRGAEGR